MYNNMKCICVNATLVILACVWSFATAASVGDVKGLYTSILNGYDIRIRPRIDQSQSVSVVTRFVPNNIIEFDTTEQKFSILGYLEVTWNDEVLTWDKAAYGNTELVKIPLKDIWKPSLILSKAFDGDGLIGESSSDIASVHHTGEVSWVPEGIFSFVCEVDIQFYPFDEQVCTLTYYVSDETFSTVALSHDSAVTLDEYIENAEWNLVKITKTKETKYEAYFINIYFVVQRRANFATFTIIVPLLMLAFLNICVFLVPIDSGEKGSFSITIFLSYGIFVTIVSDTLPHNSLQISFFVLFLIVLLMLSVLSVFYTIMQSKLVAALGDKECKLRLFCCFNRKRQAKVHPDEKAPWEIQDMDNGEHIAMSEKVEKVQMEPEKGVSVVDKSDESKIPRDENEEIAEKGEEEDEIYTWRMFFERLDTVLFVVFFLLIVVSSTVFFCLMMQRLGVNSFQGMGV